MIRITIFTLLSSTILSVAWGSSEFDQWFKVEMDQYKTYQEEGDREFSQFLKKGWHEYRIASGITRDATPKPMNIPVAPSQPLKAPEQEQPIPVTIKLPPLLPPKKITPPSIPITEPKGTKLTFEFYGVTLEIGYDSSLENHLPDKINNNAIADFWDKLSQTDSKALIKQIKNHRNNLSLNDWGYAQLIYAVGKKIYHHDNESSLFTWFILSKSGYTSRVGYSNEQVFLLLPSQHQIFETSYFTYDQRKFYVAALDGKVKKVRTLFTYKGHYPGTDRLIDLSINKLPILNVNNVSKDLNFSYKGKPHSVNVKYDNGLFDYLNDYPVTELEIYFSSSASESLSQTLLSSLKPLVEGQSETEAVNILLRFVQTAFDYKTDDDQFGREKYFFAEELFFYKYSDCEDRSVLFSYLVKNLLGLEVIALNYPGHVATAVHFNSNPTGKAVTYKNKKYMVADPTYINAKLGMVMPRYKVENPEVIPIGSF